MKILYGVSGEGFGHSSRAKAITRYLEKKGHEVRIITSLQGYEALKDEFNVFKTHGMRLIFEKNKLKNCRTFFYNCFNFPRNLKKRGQLKELVGSFKPDLCISDMEPIVTILANMYKIPLISLDNQRMLTNLEIKIPKKYKKGYLLAKGIINSFSRGATHYIVMSFSNAKKVKKNTFIVPPIIRNEVKQQRKNIKYGDKILVYLTKENKKVLKVLKKINEKFVIYGYNKNAMDGNLEFKKKDSFLDDLIKCKAIIATAGFSLISEAVCLNKPYFALPFKGHFEQIVNALFLREASFGDYSEKLTEKDIKDFLKNLDKYKKKLKTYNPDYDKVYSTLNKIIVKFKS